MTYRSELETTGTLPMFVEDYNFMVMGDQDDEDQNRNLDSFLLNFKNSTEMIRNHCRYSLF